ncbi:MAG: nucleotidyltransferase family protein [Bacteroidota bacterium]
MQISTAIILAGGLGTRLRSVVSDLPKCMAPINQRPFLDHVIQYLKKQGIQNFIFSLGYKADTIIEHIQTHYSDLNAEFAIEPSPLGTGGAIHYACQYVHDDNVIIVNGDTLFEANLNALAKLHISHHSECTIALKPMKDFQRYGIVTLNEQNQVTGFKEKQYYSEGLINGGIYALNIHSFLAKSFKDIFSFEKDYLEAYSSKGLFCGYESDAYFIDIGIPEDYERAQKELKF